MSQKRKASEIEVEDIRKVYSLFIDVKRSEKFLKDFEKEFMFHELQADDEKMNIDN